MDVRTVSYVSGGVEQAMELSHLQTKQTGGRSERSISGSEPSKQPTVGGPNVYAPSVVSSQLRPQPVSTAPTPAPVPVPVSIPPVRSSQPQQVRFTSEPRTEVKFVPSAPLKTPLVRPLLAVQQPQLQQHPRDATAPAVLPAPITLRQPIILQQAPFAMDPVRPNPGMPPGAQMMRPPVNVGPPRTGTPTQPQPPRPGGMYTGPHQPPGVPMPMRPQMPPGAGVPGMQPGMQPRPPSAQGMQRPPMMGQPPPIRPPNPMGGPRPTISPQNSNLGGVPMQAGMGAPRPPMPMQGSGGVGGPAGAPQGMRPNFYNRPMGSADPSRPPSGIDIGGAGGMTGGPPSSATPSVDDDEDVVIGRVPTDSSSALNSPNPARAPSRNFNMPGPPSATGIEREKSIPSRPPSVAGNYGKAATNEYELDSTSGRPLHALKDFINKDPSRPGQSPNQSPSPGSQQSLSPANTDENFTYRPGPKPSSGQQQYKMQPPPSGTRPNAHSPSAAIPGGRADGDKVTFQIPNGGGREGSQEWNSRSRPPQQHMIRTGPKSLTADHKGDNDSGVDEYTQEKDRPNALASPASPLKSPSKIPGLARRPENISSETRSRSTSKQRANAKTPETPSEQPLIKKVPMNKIQVGGTPSPNLKVVKSKIGSLENASHKPGGGHVKIETKKVDIKAAPRIEAKNDAYVPKGGDKKIISTKLQWNAKPKIGSLDNASHKPGGGDKRIESIKTDFKEKAKPKIGSKDNITYKPGGGDIKIVHQKLDIKAESKIGSLDNLKHKPGGGDKKIFDDKEYLKNIEHPITPSPSTQRSTSMRRMTASVSGVDLCRSIEYEPVRAPPLATASLTASLSIPSECIVLSVANEPSPERKVQKLESASCYIRKDGRAIHPKPFRTY
ncbi:microtubule-associated protein tau isoform X1 [Anopheles funestus]|uniref:microtubule-associated protein tau isoform X1 n=1 Tax=Anopheles funestus TaxID=62324 RepID=UPI0020C6E877|nr:microtubule-associated protein tau isoform X1 [Anopheles funestus]